MQKVQSFKSLKSEYENTADLVSKFLGSDEEDKHLTAELHRDWLIKAFTDMDSEGKALLELVPLIVPVPSVNEVEVYSCSKEKLVHRAHLV